MAESDEGGDIRSFLELIFDRTEGGLTGLELSAKRKQGFNPVVEKIRQMQEKQLYIWETSVKLLALIVGHRLTQLVEPVGGTASIRLYDAPLDLDDYLEVCGGRSVSRSWAFTVRIDIPGVPRLEKLAYIGHRSNRMHQAMSFEGGPSLYWSSKNPANFPKWLTDAENSPYAMEVTSKAGNGNEWIARLFDDSIQRIQTTDLASRVADALVSQVRV